MLKYDLHIHTYYSRCSNLKPAVILKTAKKKGLDGVAITDHNTIKGALEVKKANKDPVFEVIIGEEIKTDKGEVLAYYLKKEIKPGKFAHVIKEIKAQKALAVIAHPYTFGLLRKPLRIDLNKIKDSIDAIESINGRCFFKFENLKAQIKAKELNLAQTAGSDAHFAFEIGKCYTEFDGGLRDSLEKRKMRIYGSISFSMLARFLSLIQKYVLFYF